MLRVFVDLETTGLSIEDKVCSIALLEERNSSLGLLYDLVNEGKKIPPIASSINNITNEMIRNKPPLTKSESFKHLKLLLQEDALLIAHNLPFELQFLAQQNIQPPLHTIDTLRVCRHLIPDLESYALNFLRYEMKLYMQESKLLQTLNLKLPCLTPHNAQSDVIITKLLFEELLLLSTKEDMISLSQKPVLIQKFEFGKYAGRYIEEIALQDSGYLRWMLNNIEDLSEDMHYTLNYYLN